MAKVNWTEDQLCAIRHKEGNMLVAAAAGSGKTAVLVERVIRLLDETDIDKMLVVTFTNAAAANMKQGIHKALTQKLEETDDASAKEHYARQLSLLPGANITTMHAFCSKFVREHFDALKLPPSIALGDVTALKLMLSESADEAIAQNFEENDPDFLAFAKETVTKTNDGILSEMVLKLYDFLMAQPDPKGFLRDTLETYETKNAEKLLKNPALAAKMRILCDKLVRVAKQNISIMQEEYAEFIYAHVYFEQDLDFAQKIYACEGNLATIENLLDTEKLPSARLAKKDVPTEISDIFKEMHGVFKATLKKIADTAHDYNLQSLTEFLALQTPQIRALCNLTEKTIAIYTKKKRDLDLLDFDDLEHLTIELLYEDGNLSPLAYSAAKGFSYLIVDEYQDTNLVQETILNALSCDRDKLFMVGDIKQSIYGFRNTAPDLFMHKSERYSASDGGLAVHLNANFRSRKCVLRFANFLFAQLMSLNCGGSMYGDQESLKHKGSFPETDEATEFYILKDPLFSKNLIDGEALFCAQKIHEMVKSGFLVSEKDGSMRPVEYRDFAILSRSMRGVAQTFYDTLTACGIPVYCDALGESFLESMEIQSLLAFLRAFDNPLQDIFLLSAFLSPVFGTPDYDLVVRIRQTAPKKSLYHCMQHYPATEPGAERVQEFLAFLHKYRKLALRLSVADLLSAFLTETNYRAYILSLHGGAERLSNVRYLETLASGNFPGAETGGLYAFISYLEKHDTYKSDFSGPKILPENANMVQLTTIHKSKGLEYPIVFLVATGKEFVRSSAERIHAHSHIGFGMHYRNAQKNMQMHSPVVKLITEAKEMEEKSEELRVLYVALTRAKEKTIVLGSIKDGNSRPKKYASYAESIPESQVALDEDVIFSGRSFLEWMLYATERYQTSEKYPLERIFVNKIEMTVAESVATSDLEPLPPTDEINKAFSYTYPYMAHANVYSKVSVTELKRMLEQTESDTYYPYKGDAQKVSFETDDTAKNRGTLTHFVLERLDFSNPDVEKTVETLLQNGEITEEEAFLVDKEVLRRFISTPLCKQIQQADFVEKELSFTIFVDSAMLNPEASGCPVQLQGTMDLIFEAENVLYIVDFKTDKITDSNRQQKIDSYRKQINFYKMGAVKLYPKRQVKGILVFLNEENGIYEV
ncbi:MAG: UvrD-helicase domain-containing protein [Clostridia bacterium]|nr:UvrD-helicase domain-containing protein [Clostridia bacterium]